MNSNFLARMEQILWLYSLSYNPLRPVICFDERPCFLIGERVDAIAMQTGKVCKEHYSYKKNGSVCLLAAIEPKTGKRFAQIHDRRTKREYAFFMRDLAAQFSEAEKICLVQDNLNTHNVSAFYETFSAEEAFELSQRFEFHYTPKSASWLNMVEIEFSALSKQCLNQRIATKEELTEKLLTIVKERMEKQIKIDWQFSIESARTKLNKHYEQVQADNKKYKQT
jgi:hypothetical protein